MEKIFESAQLLCQLPTVSGNEQEGFPVLLDFCGGRFDEVKTTPVGSFIGIKRCGKKNAKMLLLDAHIDEIGFVVSNVFDDGFVSVAPVGGIDTRVLSASEVTIYGRESIHGVFISKPPHLQAPGEEKKKIELKDLYIDTGLDGEHLKELVRVGDFADMKITTERLANDCAVSKAFDDKICVALILRALDLMEEAKPQVDICCLFSGGEETGYKGSTTGAFCVAPDYAIAIDVCNPRFPEGDKSREHVELGYGGVISYSGTTCRPFTKKLIDCADRNGLKYVIKADPGRTGTNAHAIAVSREGVPTALISIPLRYMHTASEVISLADCLETAKLLSAFACELGGEN